MTNHPRRAGRRKHQRQQERRWTDLTPYVSDIRIGEQRLAVSRLAVAPAGTQPSALGPTWGRTGRAG